MRDCPSCWLCRSRIVYRKIAPPRAWKALDPEGATGPANVFLHHWHRPVPIETWGNGWGWVKWNEDRAYSAWDWMCAEGARFLWNRSKLRRVSREKADRPIRLRVHARVQRDAVHGPR